MNRDEVAKRRAYDAGRSAKSSPCQTWSSGRGFVMLGPPERDKIGWPAQIAAVRPVFLGGKCRNGTRRYGNQTHATALVTLCVEVCVFALVLAALLRKRPWKTTSAQHLRPSDHRYWPTSIDHDDV
ncbi:hypothetical protein VTO42DRAFT_5743 [Malbranchea cinnamomea]